MGAADVATGLISPTKSRVISSNPGSMKMNWPVTARLSSNNMDGNYGHSGRHKGRKLSKWEEIASGVITDCIKAIKSDIRQGAPSFNSCKKHSADLDVNSFFCCCFGCGVPPLS